MAEPILIRRHSVLFKLEATPGTDSVPTGAANALKVSNMKISPLQVEMVGRATSQPYLGNSRQIMVAGWTRTEFDVEIAGAGEPGDVPQYGGLLQACGFAETVVADTEVIYSPISTGFKYGTLHTNIDGVLYKSIHMAGSVALTLNSRGVPSFRFGLTGMYVPVVDAGLPAVTYRDVTPIAVTKANTPLFTVDGYAAVMAQLSLDMKVQVSYRNLANYEGVRYTDRAPGGRMLVEATKVADRNWWNSIRNAEQLPMALTHGTVAGNIVELVCPSVQLLDGEFETDSGIQMFASQLMLNPSAGDDELVITVR